MNDKTKSTDEEIIDKFKYLKQRLMTEGLSWNDLDMLETNIKQLLSEQRKKDLEELSVEFQPYDERAYANTFDEDEIGLMMGWDNACRKLKDILDNKQKEN